MKLKQKFFAQFSNPKGILGSLAGFVMTVRPSNLERNNWGVSLLDIKPADVILELGYGPGLVIKQIADRIADGIVYGADYSELMYKKASQRNKKGIIAGKVKLFNTPADNLPRFDKPIDKVIEINSLQFWPEPVKALKGIKDAMRPGGAIFLLHQPRNQGATEKDADDLGNKIAGYLKEAGFKNIKSVKRIMEPVAAVCVTAINE